MVNFNKMFFWIALFTTIGNIGLSLHYQNFFAFGGWITAFFWFPYEHLRSSQSKSKAKVDNE